VAGAFTTATSVAALSSPTAFTLMSTKRKGKEKPPPNRKRTIARYIACDFLEWVERKDSGVWERSEEGSVIN